MTDKLEQLKKDFEAGLNQIIKELDPDNEVKEPR